MINVISAGVCHVSSRSSWDRLFCALEILTLLTVQQQHNVINITRERYITSSHHFT